MTASRRIEELRAEARYARERYDIYRAKMYGLRPTTMTRFRELEQIHQRTPDREIAVKGDRDVKYGAVIDVLKACREVGFNNVGLIAQPKKSPQQGTGG